MVMLIISYGKGMPDWLLIAVIALGLILSLVITITLLNKYNSVKGLITLNDWGIQIEFEHTTLFFRRKMYSSAWTDLRAFSSNYSAQKKTRFYKVGFRDPAINIYIDDVEYVPDSATETLFGSFVLEKVNEHNRHHK